MTGLIIFAGENACGSGTLGVGGVKGPVVDGRDDCEYAGDGVLGTGEREMGRGDSEGIKNLTCFLALVCSVEVDLEYLAIGDETNESVGVSSEGPAGLAR